MFTTSLRRRASFAAAIPGLTAAVSGLGLKESQLQTHDIALPLNTNVDPKTGNTLSTRQLRLLLLSRTSVSKTRLEETVKRIQHFASLTGGQDLAIIFLLSSPPPSPLAAPPTNFISAKQFAADAANLTPTHDDGSEGVVAYSKLQAELMSHPDIPTIPILPLANISGLPELMKKHIAALTRSPPPPPPAKPSVTSFELLQLCTAGNTPMPQQTAYILSDLFPNFQELAEACTSVSSAPNSSSPSARAAAGVGVNLLDGLMAWTQGSSDAEVGRGGDGAEAKLKRLRDLVGERECVDLVEFWREEWTVE